MRLSPLFLTIVLSGTACVSTQTAAQQPDAGQPGDVSVAPGATVRVATRWRLSGVQMANAQELVLPGQATVTDAAGRAQQVDFPLARVLITSETRTSAEDAVRRLQEIAASRPEPARFVDIGGWPAVEIDFTEALPRRGIAAQNPPSQVPRSIVAIARDRTVINFDISLTPDAPATARDQAKEMARTAVFESRGNPEQVKRAIQSLDDEARKRRPPPGNDRSAATPPPSSPSTQSFLPVPAAFYGERSIRRDPTGKLPQPGLATVQAGNGELEIATSADARTIVIGSGGGLAFSTNLGATFAASAVGAFGMNDPSLARGRSGAFYVGVIAFPNGTAAHLNATGCTNAVSRSTNNGATFALQGYSARCPQSGAGICFPDQEHIASDIVNQAAGMTDQVYAVWRNFTPAAPAAACNQIGSGFVTSSIACSRNNGTTWTATAAIAGAGDFPRVAVGRDGAVYVTTINGNNVLLHRFSSCVAGLTQDPGFPVTVATRAGAVACPMPGLDRCNDGNDLSSPTVAPDPNDANHVFVTFAERSGAGERILTFESTNRGANFTRQTTVSNSTTARRFMPWSCSTLGRSFTGWYDRSPSTTAANDRTDYFFGSAWGTSRNLTNNPDPQCASGWPCAPRSAQDADSCSIQPQLAGFCVTAAGANTGNRCDFNAGGASGCPATQSCTTGAGCPKYGDYNGIACAGNWVIAGWASATSPQGLPPAGGLRVFSTSIFVGHPGAPTWRYTGVPCTGNACPGWQRLDNNPKTIALASSGSSLYQLHNDGWIWRYTGTACDVDICPGWVRLDRNLKTIAIAAGGDQLYQLHTDGAIWRHTGAPCTGESCPGWQRLDGNAATIAIAAGGNNLYQLHNTGRIWRYTGTPCTGASCPGWQMLDGNTSTIGIAATNNELYQLHKDGRIWRFSGVPCTGTSCPGWQMLDTNAATVAIAAGGGQLYQLHSGGRLWRYTGAPCTGPSTCPGWQAIDNNSKTVAMSATDTGLFQLHHDGWIWRYTGAPCTGPNTCPGWQRIDNNPRTGMVSGGNDLYQLHTNPLYQLHNNGTIWRYTGTECDGDTCPGWQALDVNQSTAEIVAAGTQLFQRHNNGRIWRFTGTPCSGSTCPGWQLLDNNPATRTIVAGGTQLFQLHTNGRIFRHTGTPCSTSACPGWQMIDANAATVAIAASDTQLFQLHNNGMIWRYTGTPCAGTTCPGWQLLDRNPNTVRIAASGNQLFQMHKGGAIWRHTGAACSGTSCPGWQMIDANPASTSIAAGGHQLYQLHSNGRIWRFTGAPCVSAQSCPGWALVDGNANTREIVVTTAHLYQRHVNGQIWVFTGPECTGNTCPGWRRLDNNPSTRALAVGGFR